MQRKEVLLRSRTQLHRFTHEGPGASPALSIDMRLGCNIVGQQKHMLAYQRGLKMMECQVRHSQLQQLMLLRAPPVTISLELLEPLGDPPPI